MKRNNSVIQKTMSRFPFLLLMTVVGAVGFNSHSAVVEKSDRQQIYILPAAAFPPPWPIG